MKIIDFKDYAPRRGGEIPPDVLESVEAIVSAVREGGDAALLEYTERFDGVLLRGSEIEVSGEDMDKALGEIPSALRASMERSAKRIRSFQELQMPAPVTMEMAPGVTAGVIYDPIETAGLYVPGGRAAYPSTVLMTAIPAKVAGVGRLIICSPPGRDGRISKAVLAAARVAGADRVFKAGGAQAIAAMAYGTETVPPVEKIFGPGNIYVTAAKLAVSRDVAIDLPAGPSDILVYAEGIGADMGEWIALDMLAQSEHDPMARSLLVTPSRGLAETVNRMIEGLGKGGGAPLEKSLGEGAIIVVRDRDEGVRAINSIAPEHLQLLGSCQEDVLDRVRNAGAVFMGEYAPVALGDYTAGTNHVLPTMGWSRRASPLSVRDYMRSRECLRCNKEGLQAIGQDAIILAEAEGLLRHAESLRARLQGVNRI